MEVILLERVARLGQMGEVVRVKDGFARNFLLRRGKALRATAENRTRFETMKSELEARSLTLKGEAAVVADKLNGKKFTVLRQASEAGQLFGSVSPRDLVALIATAGFTVNRSQIVLNAPIKTIGQHPVPISLHPEIETLVTRHRRPQQRRGGTHRARRGRRATARRADAGRSGGDCGRGLLRARGGRVAARSRGSGTRRNSSRRRKELIAARPASVGNIVARHRRVVA